MVKAEELTVLVVDDEEDVREYLGDILEDHGFNVVKASDGVEALAAVEKEPPDFISLDLVMPNKSGIKFLHELRHHKAWAKIPVMIVTAHAHDELGGTDLQGALAIESLSGPKSYLEKPVQPADYVRAIREHLRVDEGGEPTTDSASERMRDEIGRMLDNADEKTLNELLKTLKRRST